ncbi:hypothetical protein [Lysinibacillus sp. NPDC096212]|uniref:hypothetical protein n=1 Tax=Lysinibacillus sp. NPDC096212 TaxID=3364135 RepID=UPI00381EA43D
MRRVIEVIFCIFAGVFLFGVIAIAFQVIGEDSPNKASIIGGILGMIGGAIGALGAYIVATYQMNKQFEYEKKKEEALKITQIKKTLKKLQLLNEFAKRFVNSFEVEFNKPYSEELSYKLKSSETSISWISNSVNDVNDELLNEGFMLDYIRFNHFINHIYNEIISFNKLPEEQKPHNLAGFFNELSSLEESLNSFDQYIKEQLEELKV